MLCPDIRYHRVAPMTSTIPILFSKPKEKELPCPIPLDDPRRPSPPRSTRVPSDITNVNTLLGMDGYGIYVKIKCWVGHSHGSEFPRTSSETGYPRSPSVSTWIKADPRGQKSGSVHGESGSMGIRPKGGSEVPPVPPTR